MLYLTNVFKYFLLVEWPLVLAVPKQPEARGAIEIIIGDVEIISSGGQNANLVRFFSCLFWCWFFLQQSLEMNSMIVSIR